MRRILKKTEGINITGLVIQIIYIVFSLNGIFKN